MVILIVSIMMVFIIMIIITSKGDRYENVSPKEYLNMVKPCLRDLINEHIPTMELNNTDNNNNNNKNTDNNNPAEWKIQLTMQNSCISTRNFEETRTISTKSEPVEIFMGINTNDVIDRLFNALLQRFQHEQET